MPRKNRKIFISYRRDDNPDFVERIRDWFIRRYGRKNVFMDFDTIPPFARFADFIQEKVRESDVLIAIIGPRWMELLHEKESRSHEDYVRIEIGLALTECKLVAPICIKGATVPTTPNLPAELRSMLDYNVAHLNSGAVFFDNIERIVRAVEQELEHRERQISEKRDNRSVQRRRGTNQFHVESTRMVATDYFDRALARDKTDHEGKIKDYTEAIRLYPQYATAYNNRGIARYNQRDYEGALADYTEAIRLNPIYANAYNNRGDARYKIGDLEGATIDYAEGTHLKQSSEAHNSRGITRGTQGDFPGALADFNEAIRFNPQYVEAYVNRGNLRYKMGDYVGAVADCSEAIRLVPEDWVAYNNRAEAYFATGQFEAALADFTEAKHLCPDSEFVIAGLAITHHAIGQVSEAVQLWRSLGSVDK